MKCALLSTLLLIMLSPFASASEALFYIGTYTNHAKSKGVYMARLDTETGKLGAMTLAGEAANPSYLAFSPNGAFLYAGLETAQGDVTAFRVEPDAKLTELNKKPLLPGGICHLWVDKTGRNVLAANYNGGKIACVQTKPDGSLGEQTALIAFTGSGPNAARQSQPHAHSIYTEPGNGFVYACDLGSDNIWSFKFDAEKGTLTPNDPPAAKVPPGSGPRHLALHPNRPFAYVCNEMACSVTAFCRDAQSGALVPFQTVSTLPEGLAPTKTDSAAGIFCHPSGKWLYVSNRGRNTFVVYSIAPDGTLNWIQDAPAQVKTPRGFALDPTGQWIIAAGQDDDKIAVLKIDPASGKLAATDQFAQVGEPTCILFAPAK